MSVQEENPAVAKIEDKRTDLEDLAESDLPASELAQSLLEVVSE